MKLGDKIFEIENSNLKNYEFSCTKNNYIPFNEFEKCLINTEKMYLKNAFLTYSTDDVKFFTFE
jgi:hypothetical protein